MKAKTAETLAWLMIYSGLLIACLGWFVRGAEPWIGHTLLAAAALDVLVGIGLIWWRSRMRDSD